MVAVAAPIVAFVQVGRWAASWWKRYSVEACRNLLGPHDTSGATTAESEN